MKKPSFSWNTGATIFEPSQHTAADVTEASRVSSVSMQGPNLDANSEEQPQFTKMQVEEIMMNVAEKCEGKAAELYMPKVEQMQQRMEASEAKCAEHVKQMTARGSKEQCALKDVSTQSVADSEFPQLEVGSYRLLQDLKEERLNGVCGVLQSFDPADGRWVFVPNGTTRLMRVKSKNIR